MLPDRTEQVCPFFGKCNSTPGQYQYELSRVRDARNSIITHKHLVLTGMPELRLDWRKSQWIDEDPTGAFLQHEQAKVKHIRALVTDHDFTELERRLALDGEKSVGTSRKGLKRLEAIRDVFLQQHATQTEPQLEDFAAWSSQELRTAASDRETIERWRRGKFDPTIPDAELAEQLAKAPAPKKLAGLLRRIADEMDARSTGPIYAYEWHRDKLVMRGRLPTTELPPNILLTDATASTIILRAVFPNHEIDFQQINIHRNAYVTQVRDLTFSRYWLLNKGDLPRVVTWLTELAARYPRLAIFTTKRIRCEITGEDRKGKLPPFALLPNTTARIGHYGNLKGSDQFKDCDAIVILGREQPNVADLGDAMKAMFYDAPEPLKFAAGDDYETVNRPYLMRDRSAQSVEVQVHPDPRGQALLEQCRECEQTQALDRGRLIHHEGPPKPVFILCSIPLPGVEVDRLVTWKELVGPAWLRHCLEEVAAGPLNALPLSAGWLAERFPALGNPKAFENHLARDRVIKALEEQAANYPHFPNITILQRSEGNPLGPSPWFPGWSLTRFRVAKKAGRRPSYALVRDGADPATAIAEALGRSADEIIIVPTVTDLGVGAAEEPVPHPAHASTAMEV